MKPKYAIPSIPRICPVCGRSFTGHSRQLVCSTTCANALVKSCREFDEAIVSEDKALSQRVVAESIGRQLGLMP